MPSQRLLDIAVKGISVERQEFKRQLVELGNIIAEGITFFSAWRGLMVEDDASAAALNRCGGFFVPARQALLWMTLRQFANVFDRHPKAVSLGNLLAEAQKDRENLTPYATEHDLQQIGHSIDASDSLRQRLKRVRDQRIAHHDAITAGDMSLRYGEVRELAEGIKSMYNSLTRAHDRWTTPYEWPPAHAERHTSEVVRIMREERDRVIREISQTDTAT